MNSSYRCGDIVFCESVGNGDHIQNGKRYHVVVSNNIGNRYSPVLVAIPLTTKIKKENMVTHTIFEAGTGGLPKRSMLLAEQATTISKSDICFRLGSLQDRDLDKLAVALVFSLPIVWRAFETGIANSKEFQRVASS